MDIPEAFSTSDEGQVDYESTSGPVFSADEEGAAPAVEDDGTHCLNCQAELVGAFCHACGQKDQDLDIRFSQLMTEWLGGVIGFDARIWRTLRTLFTRPGLLTVDYFEGRRARYVSPLRLYLVASLLMLLSLAWSGQSVIQDNESSTGMVRINVSDSDKDSPDSASESEPEEADGEGAGAVLPQEGEAEEEASEAEGEGEEDWDDVLESTLEALGEGASENRKAFDKSFRDYLPQALFALVPLFAMQLWLLFRRRYKRYLFHLIFSLHIHAAVFFIIVVTTPIDRLLGFEKGLGDIAGLGFFIYLFMALRRVYGDSRLRVGFKLLLLSMVHGILLSVALLAAVVLAAWRVQGG